MQTQTATSRRQIIETTAGFKLRAVRRRGSTRRAVRQRFDAELRSSLSRYSTLEPIQYTTDDKGRTVRVPTDSRWVTRDEIRDVLLFKRVTDEAELLEAVGVAWMRYMIQKRYVVRGADGHFLWITNLAEKVYDLPKPKGLTGTGEFVQAD